MYDFTCAQEHDSIVAILSRDTVYCNLCEPVLSVDPREDWPTADRVHRVVHKRVHANKANDIIWEIFSAFKTWVICATWTLYKETGTFSHLVQAAYIIITLKGIQNINIKKEIKLLYYISL